MTTRTIATEADRDLLVTFIREQKLPFTVTIERGKRRTAAQNRLQREWCREIAEQTGEYTPEEVRGFNKLHFGVPILREENEDFRLKYDAVVKPLPYQHKLLAMQEPLDMPVTRMMTTEQKTRYLDAIYQHWSGRGVLLTQPEAA